jgi:hypothetical protein
MQLSATVITATPMRQRRTFASATIHFAALSTRVDAFTVLGGVVEVVTRDGEMHDGSHWIGALAVAHEAVRGGSRQVANDGGFYVASRWRAGSPHRPPLRLLEERVPYALVVTH